MHSFSDSGPLLVFISSDKIIGGILIIDPGCKAIIIILNQLV